jgi:signal transduction histidine kinase
VTRLSELRDWLGRHPLLRDVAVAGAVLAASLPPLVNSYQGDHDPAPTWGFVLVVVQALLLLGRRSWPFLANVAVGASTAVYGVSALPDPAVPFAGLVAVYSAAAYASRRLALLSGAIAGLGIAISLSLDQTGASVQDWSVNYLVFATAWLLGWAARTNREVTAALAQRAEQLERTREAEARRAVVEERNRIAREMHDVIAHALSLMIVQAEAGPVVVPRDPDRAIAAFDAISGTGKQALTEMRRLLGVLRDDAPSASTRNPQAGIAELDDLVRTMRAAGLDVVLSTDGPLRVPDTAVDLSAYRIVQEALTNVLKHAGPAHVTVRLVGADDALRIEVTDDGLGGSIPAPAHDGRGLIGMRERVSMVDGELFAGPGDHGGWTVRASLPLRPAMRP